MTALNAYFSGVASKYLSAVDVRGHSNQHEIGSNKFTAILGNPGSQKLRFTATFLFFDPETDEAETLRDVVTYYDTRLNQLNRSAEYRLYYRDNPITEQLRQGDFCLVGALTNGELLIAVAPRDSEHERRLRYLFNVDDAKEVWAVDDKPRSHELDLASRGILEALGVELVDDAGDLSEKLQARFGLTFPTTRVFSAFARDSLELASAPELDPDGALEEWMKREEVLFRDLERRIVEIRIRAGFDSVDDFVAFSLSVQNRRKSRVGHALENHLEALFNAADIPHVRGGRTEGSSKPDFLFPSLAAYRNPDIESPPLQMLAAKSTCKDRWRQILAEAERIPRKHLFTLETAISESQTSEMKHHRVQLVVPPSVARTFTAKQRSELMSLREFIELLLTL